MYKTHAFMVYTVLVISAVLYSANAQTTPYDRYVYGDNKGTSNATVQAPRPIQYPIYSDTSDTSTGVANATDSSFQGNTSWRFEYNLNDWDTSLTPDGPKKYAGLGWYWLAGASTNVTGATHLRFAYKMSNATHKLTINMVCFDTATVICTDSTCSDTNAAVCPDSICSKTGFATRSLSYVVTGAGGTGSTGRHGWKLDSIPLSAWGDSLCPNAITGIQFMMTYLDTNAATSHTGVLQLDEICFKGVTAAVKSPLNLPLVFGDRFFRRNGTVTVSYFSMQGREISSSTLKVKAGQSCSEAIGSMPDNAAGTYLVKVKGAGVNVSSKLIR